MKIGSDSKSEVKFGASVGKARHAHSPIRLKNTYTFTCRRADGTLRWIDTIENLVVNEGLDDVLTQYFTGTAYTAAHFLLLTDSTPTFAPGDTMATHPGWTEDTGYVQATRKAIIWDAVSGQSISNLGSPSTFTITGAARNIGGAGITTDSTKGGTIGTLYGGDAFTGGDQPVDTNDVLTVDVTVTASSA